MTSHSANVFLVSKTWLLRNTPRFRHVLILEFWFNVGQISLHSSKSPRFWQAKVGHYFLASKTRFLWNTPRFWHVLNLRFRYDVSQISLYSFKVITFWQAKVGHRFFGVKNMVLMKYVKILTGAKPKISIRCKLNIFVPFKSPKILTSKIGHVFFCVCFFCLFVCLFVFFFCFFVFCQKHGSYEIPQDFDRCFTWHRDKMYAQNLCPL